MLDLSLLLLDRIVNTLESNTLLMIAPQAPRREMGPSEPEMSTHASQLAICGFSNSVGRHVENLGLLKWKDTGCC